MKRARDVVSAFPVALDRGAAPGLAGLLALTLAWAACTGAFYEWGGAGARGVKELKDKRKRVTVDLSALRLIDSSGVGAIVSLYKRVRAQGGKVGVTGLRDQPLAIFKLLRLDKVLVG